MTTTISQISFNGGTIAFWCQTTAFTPVWNMFLGDVSNGSNFLGRADGDAGSGSNRIRLRSGSDSPDADWLGTFPEFVGAWVFVAVHRVGNQVELFLGYDGDPLTSQGVRTCATSPLSINTLGDGFTGGAYAHNGSIDAFEHDAAGTIAALQTRYAAEADNYHGAPPPPPSGGTAIVIAGQSNATSATIPNLWAEVATRCQAVYGVTPEFVEVSLGGTGLVSPANWEASGSAYQAAVTAINAAGYSDVPLILWHQGEADAMNNVGPAEYHAALADLLQCFRDDCTACVNADLATVVLGPWPDHAAGIERIRDGQRAAIDYTPGIVAGPDLSQRKVRAADGVHFSDPADRDYLAESWLPIIAEYMGAA